MGSRRRLISDIKLPSTFLNSVCDSINSGLPAIFTQEQVTPQIRRIILEGETLAGFTAPRPEAHIKLLFGSDPNESADLKKMRSQVRTYTPRSFNLDTNALTVEFVLHGNGLASTWAAQPRLVRP